MKEKNIAAERIINKQHQADVAAWKWFNLWRRKLREDKSIKRETQSAINAREHNKRQSAIKIFINNFSMVDDHLGGKKRLWESVWPDGDEK